MLQSVADPDLQIRRGQSSRPRDKEGGSGLQNNFFQPFGPQFGLKIRGGSPPEAPPLDPPLAILQAKSIGLEELTYIINLL